MAEPLDIALKGRIGAFDLDIAFAVPAAGITAIWGASGAGKSALLRAIAGLSPLEGHVRIGQTVWQNEKTFMPVHKRRIGFIFQDASLFSHLSVQGNLDYAQKRNGGTKIDAAGIVEHLRLGSLLNRSVNKLSGGEQQRVALARTLFSAPDILLMDEPLSSLDSNAKSEIIPLIAQLGRQRHLPILYVSHDAYEIERLADRTLRIKAGRLIDSEEKAFENNIQGMSDVQIRALATAALKAGLRV